MNRLFAVIVSFALVVAGVVVGAPAASASTVWNFPDGTIAVEDSISHAPAEVKITGLQITDGNVTAGSVQLSGQQTFCTTRSFSGNSAVFSDLGAFGCNGSLEFSVSPTGQLSVATQALGGAHLLVSGSFSSGIVGTMPAPIVVPLTGCTATLDDAAQTVAFDMTGGNPDATKYEVTVSGGTLPTTTFLPTDVPFDLGVDYSFLVSGQPVSATIEAKRADGMVVATCVTNAVTPWRAPGAPKIDSTVPVIGGLVTINYSVADPATVQGIEYRLDNAGSWIRPGGTAPTGGVGGAFTVNGLAEGNHTVTLRTVGFDPNSLTTLGTDESFDIPAPPKKPNGATRPSQGTAVVAIGSTPSKPVAVPPPAPVSAVSGTSNGAGTGTNGALAATTGDGGIDAPCLAEDGTLYPNQYSTVGSQLTMAPNTHGLGKAKTFTVVGGALPPGMQLDRRFGVLFGVTTQAGSWVTTVQAKFADGSTKSGQFTTRVDADPQTLQYAAQNIGSVGSRIAIAPTTNAPVVGTSYVLVCGKLPAGTRLDARTGVIVGKPTAVVVLPTPLRVAESSATGKAAASFIFVVNKRGTTTISYPAHPHVRVGKRVAIRPTVAGVGDIALFRMWKGKLPKGLHLNRTTGVVSGRIAHSGPTHTITIVAVTKGGALLTAAPMKLSLKR